MRGSDRVQLGIALEAPSENDGVRDAIHLPGISFVEYGLHMSHGIPAWLCSELDSFAGFTTLHPLDLNLAEQGSVDAAWLRAARDAIGKVRATCLVSDFGYWYYGRRERIWFRPSVMPASAQRCFENAAHIARQTGVPFRIENPPLEWASGTADLWAHLAACSDDAEVEICLDLSHLIQLEQNAGRRWPELPPEFPWHRVAELHLAGYVEVELRGELFKLDQHLAGIGAPQLRLCREIVRRVLDQREAVCVCLEMEPQPAAAIDAALEEAARTLVGVAPPARSADGNRKRGAHDSP